MKKISDWFRLRITAAVPTCTLFQHDPSLRVYRFRPWPRWYVTELEVFLAELNLLP